MKFSTLPLGFAGSFFLSVLLIDGPSALKAEPTRRTRKTPVEDTVASPSPSSRQRHTEGKSDATQAPVTPKPGTIAPKEEKQDAGTAKQTDRFSTAAEAAPSKAMAVPGSRAAAPAATATIEPGEIQNFDAQPEPIRQMLTAALDLARKNLTYSFGSADPAAGGMDCSGTIYYLLKQRGFDDVPRQANEQYSWVREKSRLYAVVSKRQDTAELREMRPGDLLFWTGTYNVDRDPPVTHTMIYLGRRKKDGHRLMFGASDGRPYDGQRRNGVSVFDFKMPPARTGDAADAATAAAPDRAPDFAGYGPIPGMADLSDAASRQTSAGHASPPPAEKGSDFDEAAPSATPKAKRSRSGGKSRKSG